MSALAEIVVIGGPTASGKSGLAMELAGARSIEIVSADSVQVYRGLDIGSAKPTLEEQAAVPHHLIDICAPGGDPYDVGRFVEDASRAIEEIASRGALPVVVGGTGLYIRHLLYGIVETPPTDPALRAQLNARAAAEGGPALHEELACVDPALASRLHPNDAVRVVRGLEVWTITGRPLSAIYAEHKLDTRPMRYRALALALAPDRQALYSAINARVEVMLSSGFVDEVRGLLDEGVDPDAAPLQTLGYRSVVDHVLGRDAEVASLEDLEVRIKRDHRRYAKRQMTWFKGQRGFVSYADRSEAAAHIARSVS